MSLPRVFLAMRSEYLRDRFRVVLEFEDYAVATAGDKATCLSGMKECLPEVLVIEPQLPGGSVEDVLAGMANDSQLSGTAVVLLGTPAQVASLGESLRSRICEYLAPPTTYTQLVGV